MSSDRARAHSPHPVTSLTVSCAWGGRLLALIGKEGRQILRDPSSWLVAFVLPCLFLLFFGYAISLDADNLRLAVIDESGGAKAHGLGLSFAHSPHFRLVPAASRQEAARMMGDSIVQGVLVLPSHFDARLAAGRDAPAQLLVDGSEPNTANFINERLIIIGEELGDVESDLESFKRDNQVVDISSSASMYMSETQKYGADAMELETQLRLAEYIKDYLTDPRKETDLIPANTGISDMNIESQITLYNTIKLKRDRLIDDSSDSNPVVEELNNSLRAMKQSIIRAVDNMVVSINVKRNDAQHRERRAQSRVASIPAKERQMLSIERQQKIKESLYLFLLNRREENALSQAMADNNARVIDGAEGSDAPISPSRNRILLLGVLVGIALPGIAFLTVLFMDTRVRGRKDIEKAVSVPFLGEIPLDKEAAKRNKGKKETLAVHEQGDDIVSEAFRILRTNMTFMAKKGKAMQVITFTSFNPGAGKTFISHNLALSLVYARKRVILVDLDIRKGTLSRHFGKHVNGVTNYLSDPTVRADDIIRHMEHFDIIPSGTVAPNPAELLMDDRLDELMDELRTRYDYIIADNVPVGLVADAAIANRIADLTIFVVRAGRLDRRQLPDIEQLYENKQLKNMALVLNGVDPHRRCYGYGYGYGYGNGYGYGKKKK
mgnify:CR=1 FL=1